MNSSYLDYEALENIKCLEGKELVVYGAGNYGKQAAEMLIELGISEFDFCDRDVSKQGTCIRGRKVVSAAEIEQKENLCVIIAIGNSAVKREVEQLLKNIEGIRFLSFFVLKMIWKYVRINNRKLEAEVEAFASWYETLAKRGQDIQDACRYSILVYQNGKVGSSTVSHSLWDAGIENTHIHRFFFKNDLVGELLLGREQKDFVKNSNVFQFQTLEYVKSLKDKMKNKKIITMVRDPIAVDLSTVFQWMGTGIGDRYFAEQLKEGKAFHQAVSEFMLKVQDRLFNWFDEELKELCGIDVLKYPFDKEKGYAVISQDGVEILLMKAEKLSQMTEVLRTFTGNPQLELINRNVGKDKEYAYIYEEVKKRLEIPKEYAAHYYKDNPYMDHFYSEEEKKNFWTKWADSVKEL